MSDDIKPKLNIATNKTTSVLQDKLKEIAEKDKEKEIEKTALSNGFGYINLKGYPISTDALSLIPEVDAKTLKLVSFFYSGQDIRFGAIEPTNSDIQKYCKNLAANLHAKSEILQISEKSLAIALKVYENVPKKFKQESGVTIKEEDLRAMQAEINTTEELQSKINTVNTTDIVTLIVASALKFDTSDIHIEAETDDIKLRLRIDGELRTMATMPKSSWEKLSSRIKLLSNIKINLTKTPQDGRFTIYLTDDKIDVRVSTMPTAYGESIVMRLLKSSSAGLQFADLGLRGKSYRDLEENVKRPNGMIVATGPTGSGKTTTLYAILNQLNDDSTKIITLEDPIEYELQGINQSQVDPGKNYTFANGLRSVLRQDPDIVMVGEIRDLETAETAINAALTGHLMISTIHTNSAAGAIPRFLAMGVKPFLLAPSINAVIGQRLVRKLCSKCKQEYVPEADQLAKITNTLSQIPDNSGDKLSEEQLKNIKFYKPVGCSECQNGYKGRVGIFEIMTMSKEVEEMILSGKVSEYDAQEIAVKNGMVTMLQDGLLKAKDGITSLEEVFEKAE